MVWEIRSNGNDNNGGGFKTGASGTDYSQQTSPQYALTSVTTAGVGATFLLASASADMVGNIAHVVSGTNFTAGFYEIISVSVGVSVTVDANICTGVGASGVINIGGALATIGKIGSASANQGAVAGNLLCVKSGSYSLTSTTETFAASGTTTSPIRICGYASTRPTVSTHGDYDLGRTNSNGDLVTTNYPTITYTTGECNITGNFIILEGVKSTSANVTLNQGTVRIAGTDTYTKRCSITNSATNANSTAIVAAATRGGVFDSDVVLSGASGGKAAIDIQAATTRVIGCRIKGGPSIGINIGATGSTIALNTIYASVGIGISVATTTAGPTVLYNTIVGGSADGINVITASTVSQIFIGNMITDNTGDGIDMVSTANAAFVSNNRFRDNANTYNNAGNWITSTSYDEVTSGAGTSDYVNAAGNDYNLKWSSPGRGAGSPLYADIGALQAPTPTPTATATFTPTATATATSTFTPTATATASFTPCAPTPGPTATATPTMTPTATASATNTPTPTPTAPIQTSYTFGN
jgi:hypothetical protein